MRKRLFWLVSRAGFGLYRLFPIFGALRASIGLIQNEGRCLVIHRNDGRGFSLPGGMAMPWEAESKTLAREIREETGLVVEESELLFHYYTEADIPCNIAVFKVRASGTLQPSWEGTPQWVTLVEFREGAATSQTPVLKRLCDPSDPLKNACGFE